MQLYRTKCVSIVTVLVTTFISSQKMNIFFCLCQDKGKCYTVKAETPDFIVSLESSLSCSLRTPIIPNCVLHVQNKDI